MWGIILIICILLLLAAAFNFTRTTKAMPKTYYEWKTEFRYQYVGIVGLIHDFIYRSRNRVSLYKQPGRVAVVTGGNRGIGLQITKKLLQCDMTVIMGVRDPISAKEAVSQVIDLGSVEGKLICEHLDVGELKTVRAFAEKVKSHVNKVDILINNAGIMFAPYKLTSDKFESHFATNHLGHFLLTHLLMPLLSAAGTPEKRARIVNVSSCANLIGKINYPDINGTKNYYPGTAYSQSKLAQILATRHLDRLLQEKKENIQVIAVHPGIVDTDLFEYSATTSVPFFKKIFFKTPEQGSRTVIYAAIEPRIEGVSGCYLSNCSKGPMHPAAKSPEQCEKLFDLSCELCNIKEFGNGQI